MLAWVAAVLQSPPEHLATPDKNVRLAAEWAIALRVLFSFRVVGGGAAGEKKDSGLITGWLITPRTPNRLIFFVVFFAETKVHLPFGGKKSPKVSAFTFGYVSFVFKQFF